MPEASQRVVFELASHFDPVQTVLSDFVRKPEPTLGIGLLVRPVFRR